MQARVLLILISFTAVAGATVTFNKDVAPVVFEHCAPCHHPGGSGPFPLIKYEDVARHAAQIAAVTQSRYMPPWPPERGGLKFAGDRSLTSRQIQLFADWLKQGKPRGAAHSPVPPQFSSEWQMGPPDLILSMPKAFHLPASGADVFRNFIVPSGLHEVRYVRAFELRMSNPGVVHHANIVLDRTQSLRKRDGADGNPGFAGMDVITEAAANEFDPDSHFLFWKPASVLRPAPDDMAWRLDPGTDLVFNLHLQPTGKEESVQGEVGIYFAKQPPTRFPILVQLEHDGAIRIPPNDKTFTVSDSLTLPVDSELLAIYPHAHYLGKDIVAWAELPGGIRRQLIHIADWDINWQAVYEYENPVFLPKGTEISMKIRYDNSAANPRNPNRPPKLVFTGNRSEDEMGHVWLQLLPKTKSGDKPGDKNDPRFDIQEAVMRRRLEKYPGDFLAQYNLAALLQTRGRLPEAASAYRSALQADPNSATAHNSLASVLMLEDDLQDAIPELRECLRLDPGYMNAHFNLARALQANGELDAAAAEYSTLLRAKPDDAAAQVGLGTIYFKKHSYPEALASFREAARLNANDADIQANLGTLLAITGDLPSAQKAFEQALAIDPNHAAALANLQRVKTQLAAKK